MNETFEDQKAERIQLHAANKALTAQKLALERKVAELEQYSRKNNVEVKGILCTQGENCLAMIKTIASKIDCPLTETDIDVVHRVPFMANSKHIIARFVSRAKKAEFITTSRRARLQTKHIGFRDAEAKPVDINDHLTMENKQFFSKALALKKEPNWQFL